MKSPLVPPRRDRGWFGSKRYSPSIEEVREIAQEGLVIPVCCTFSADLCTPASIYLSLAEFTSPSFLLESIEGGDKLGRYSYIGLAPEDRVVLRNGVESEDPLKIIQDQVSKVTAKIPGLPPFVGGYVGYIGYEVVHLFEPRVPVSNTDVLEVPDAMLFNYNNVIVFDHARNELKVIGNIHVDDADNLEDKYEETTSRVGHLADYIRNSLPFIHQKNVSREVKAGISESNFDRGDYLRAIEKAKEYISNGDAIQVVLSQRFARRTEADPFSIYRALRRVNPSPFMVYFNYGDFQIIGASPELLLRVDEGIVTTHPIAGTRPRGKTPEEDKRLEEELSKNEKEKAEHRMLLDLGRNDVGRVSAPGTVEVTKKMEIERFSHVMHLSSAVKGALSNQYSSLDALRSVFPAGTVSGAPKIRAMEIIDELEGERRGPYAGAMGYVSYDGNLEMAITIRTIVFKDGVAYVQAGGGIVYDSDPEAEFEETVNKAKASLRAIELAEEEYI